MYFCAMKWMKQNKAKKDKKASKKKVIKKNTTYRNFRAWVLRLEHRQKNDTPPIVVRDTDTHVCRHCGSEYTGAFCPKCSMPARWKRFNWRLLFLNFIDIWGLGTRSMFRTIRDLFWRPGYMIKDYLRGHHLSYFPPFKMLAVWTVLLLFMMWLIKYFFGAPDVEPDAAKNLVGSINHSFDKISSTTSMLINHLERVLDFLDENMLYGIIVRNVLVVIAVKWAFSKVSDFNYVETFISQIYINCQFHILAIAGMLLTWQIPDSYSLFPYMKGLIFPPLVLAYDFHQLYGVKWKKALWKTVVVLFNLVVLYLILGIIMFSVLGMVEHFTNPGSDFLQVKVP